VHPAARAWVARHAPDSPADVVDIGGRNINGSVRDLFTGGYLTVDLAPGPGVDVVADFTTWTPESPVPVAVCCEVFEHSEQWRAICWHAAEILTDDGTFLLTAAGPGRAPHSGHDGGPVQAGEWYRNIEPGELDQALTDSFWCVTVDVSGEDVRAVARYPRR
jgi:hypothetical protein